MEEFLIKGGMIVLLAVGAIPATIVLAKARKVLGVIFAAIMILIVYSIIKM